MPLLPVMRHLRKMRRPIGAFLKFNRTLYLNTFVFCVNEWWIFTVFHSEQHATLTCTDSAFLVSFIVLLIQHKSADNSITYAIYFWSVFFNIHTTYGQDNLPGRIFLLLKSNAVCNAEYIIIDDHHPSNHFVMYIYIRL